jgi:predicted ribosome quality control (RQC) complex YloA/Tae2 family protein|tara:strand:+ start:142 stop:549 length:408 start_codon:yes stop_codon:yes gene_type:complete
MILYKEIIHLKHMLEYTSLDGIKIQVGQDAKENDQLTMTSDPKHWWLHVSGCPGAHVVVCHSGDQLPKETKRDAAVLAVYHSKTPNTKMSPVDLARVDQISKYQKSNHGLVTLEGEVMQLTVFMNKEKQRLDRLK